MLYRFCLCFGVIARPRLPWMGKGMVTRNAGPCEAKLRNSGVLPCCWGLWVTDGFSVGQRPGQKIALLLLVRINLAYSASISN